jgi:hypothetical protein
MAKVAVPIERLNYEADNAFSNEVIEVFMDHGSWNPADDVTFTGRVEVDGDTPEGRERRDAIKVELAVRFGADEAKRLIAVLDARDWDVSFFVDCW